MQLVGRLTSQPPWANRGKRPEEVEESPPLVGKPPRGKPPPLIPEPGTPRRRGELCPQEAMDCSLPPPAWELPLPPGEEMEGELGLLEEMGVVFTEPSPAASSLGFWADECEQADAALAAAEA